MPVSELPDDANAASGHSDRRAAADRHATSTLGRELTGTPSQHIAMAILRHLDAIATGPGRGALYGRTQGDRQKRKCEQLERTSPVSLRKRATAARVRAAAPPLVVFALVFATSLFAAGCGRRATDADCSLIVDKSVELQLKDMKLDDADQIRKQEDSVRAQLQPEIGSCEGRRVTERAMNCVKAAQTTQDLDRCLQ